MKCGSPNARLGEVADEGLDGHSDGCADQCQALATQLPQQRAVVCICVLHTQHNSEAAGLCAIAVQVEFIE